MLFSLFRYQIDAFEVDAARLSYRQKSVQDSDLTPLFRQAFSKKKSVMDRGERCLLENVQSAAAR